MNKTAISLFTEMCEVKNVLMFLLQILLQHQVTCHWNATNCCKGYCVFGLMAFTLQSTQVSCSIGDAIHSDII